MQPNETSIDDTKRFVEVWDPFADEYVIMEDADQAVIEAVENAAIKRAEFVERLSHFAIVDKEIWTDPTLKDSAKVIYGYLASCRNTKTNLICPSVADIMAKTGKARKTVFDSFTALEDAGYIKREKRFRNNQQVTSSYSLTSIESHLGKAKKVDGRHLSVVTDSNSLAKTFPTPDKVKTHPSVQKPNTGQNKTQYAPVTPLPSRPPVIEFHPDRTKGGWADPDQQAFGKAHIAAIKQQLKEQFEPKD